MNPWVPVSPCDTACAAEEANAGAAPAWRWTAALTADMALAAWRLLLSGSPGSAVDRRKIALGATELLTALGVRVEVVPPAAAWPEGGEGRLVVANHISWLDELALLSVVPAIPVAKAEIAAWPIVGLLARRMEAIFVDRTRVRGLPAAVAAVASRLRQGETVLVHPEGTTACGAELGRFRRAFFQSAVDANVAVCPVALRYRLDGRPTTLAAYVGDETLWRSLTRVLAARELVVEIHLLQALQPAGADRRILAALAEYAIAQVTEVCPPVTRAHAEPRRMPRRPTGSAAVSDTHHVSGLDQAPAVPPPSPCPTGRA